MRIGIWILTKILYIFLMAVVLCLYAMQCTFLYFLNIWTLAIHFVMGHFKGFFLNYFVFRILTITLSTELCFVIFIDKIISSVENISVSFCVWKISRILLSVFKHSVVIMIKKIVVNFEWQDIIEFELCLPSQWWRRIIFTMLVHAYKKRIYITLC